MSSLAERLAKLQADVKDDAPNELEFDLVPEEGTTGVLKQLALDQIAAFKASGFKIAILEKHIIHGRYDGETSAPASLLVLEFHVRSERKNLKRRIRYLSVSVRFEADPRGPPSGDPFLLSWEPAMRAGVFVHSSNVMYTKADETKLAVTAKKDPVPLEVTGERGHSTQAEFDRPDRVVCMSNPSMTPGKGGTRTKYDQVVWTIRENESQETMPDAFSTAMVVQSATPNMEKFKVVFEVKVYIDWWGEVNSAFDRAARVFKGHKEISKVYYGTESVDVPDSVEKNNLKDLVLGDGLMDFCWFHVPEEIATKKFYEGKKRAPVNT